MHGCDAATRRFVEFMPVVASADAEFYSFEKAKGQLTQGTARGRGDVWRVGGLARVQEQRDGQQSVSEEVNLQRLWRRAVCVEHVGDAGGTWRRA